MTTRTGWLLSAAALLVLTGWLGYDSLATNVFGKKPWPDSVIDYRLLYDYSRQVVETGRYPPGYPYPPSAVVMHAATTGLPFAAAATTWMALTFAAGLACWLTLARLLGLSGRDGTLALLLPAHLAASHFFQWELRSQNCNLVFLAALLFGVLALHRGRAGQAGFWLALAFSLKLFCVLLVPYLLWRGQRRAFAWMAGFVLVFWLALPPATFGMDGSLTAYGDWWAQMRQVTANRHDGPHPILIALRTSAEHLAGGEPVAAGLIVNAARLVWGGVLLLAWRASARREERPGDAFGLLADVSALLLAPIALSPYLEPYHAVASAIPALLLVWAAADRSRPARARILALVLFVASVGIARLPLGWELRGLLVNARLLLVVTGSIWVASIPRSPTARPIPEGAGLRRGAA